MPEIYTLVDDKTVNYTGLFRMDELYAIISKHLRSRGYFIIEKMDQEDVLEKGKQVLVSLEPEKKFNDYAKSKMRVEIFSKHLKDRLITLNGHKQKYQQGEVTVKVFSFLETDRQKRMEGSGLQLVLRTLSDKFIRRDFVHQMRSESAKDALDLVEEVKSYLNISRFKIQAEK
jgi:hypothetical protein